MDLRALMEQIDNLDASVQAALAVFVKVIEQKVVLEDGQGLMRREAELEASAKRFLAQVLAEEVQQALDSEAMGNRQRELIGAWPKNLKFRGDRQVRIRTLWGEALTACCGYWGGKHRGGRGLYPGLQLLGIHDRCTPQTGSEMTRLVVALGSLREAQAELGRRGVEVGVKVLQRVARLWSSRVRNRLGQRLAFQETLAGCRVAVAIDGGRIRTRKDRKGRKTARSRHRYRTDWREPKLLILYRLDENGRLDATFPPIIDGTLKGPDALLALLRFYLDKLDVRQAETLVFTADGAPWIWERIQPLLADWPIPVYRGLDFYHASEHLVAVAGACKGWSAKQRKTWWRKQQRRLLKGQVDPVIEAIAELARGRRRRAVLKELNYFTRHREHLAYDRLCQAKLPIGSGAIESAIRRVVNLRLKSAAAFWKETTAEGMLLLRAWFKAGRWNTLENIPLAPTPDCIA